MAAAFLFLTLALIAMLARQRNLAISMLCIGIIGGAIVFWFHATDILKINW